MYKLYSLFLILFVNLQCEDKRFVIIIPSYKNADYYKKNIDSAINQNYDKTKFRIVYIDDWSPDDTSILVEKYIKEKNALNIIKLRKNRLRRGAMGNLWSEINLCDPEEIVIMLDGDDALKDENVLKYLNEVYQDNNIWLTYGQYECDPIKYGLGFAAEYSDEVKKNRDYRNEFLATHLRTFYAWLFQNIKVEDLVFDDVFATMTWDCAIMFPSLEMCGNKHKFISKILYKYNMENPLSDFKTDPTLMFFMADYYKKQKPKYAQLTAPKFIPAQERYKNPSAVSFIYGVDKYLSPGIDINLADFKGRTPLVQSVKFAIKSFIEFLIDKGADVNKADFDGMTPLMYAIIFTNTDTVKYLISKGAVVSNVNNFGYNALYYAKKYNKGEMIQLIEAIK